MVKWSLRFPGAKASDQKLTTATSGNDGIASLPLDAWRHKRFEFALSGFGRIEHVLELGLAGAQHKERVIPDGPEILPPREVLTLTASDHGTVAVRVVDPGIGAHTTDAQIYWVWRAAAPQSPSNKWLRGLPKPELQETGRMAGTYLISPVGTGTELRVVAYTNDRSRKQTELVFAGPTRLGEIVHAELELGELYPLVRVCVVQANGERLAHTRIRWRVRSKLSAMEAPAKSDNRDTWGKTDSDGCLAAPWPGVRSLRTPHPPHAFQVLLPVDGGEALHGWCPFPLPLTVLAGEVCDLGSLTLSAPPAASRACADGGPHSSAGPRRGRRCARRCPTRVFVVARQLEGGRKS